MENAINGINNSACAFNANSLAWTYKYGLTMDDIINVYNNSTINFYTKDTGYTYFDKMNIAIQNSTGFSQPKWVTEISSIDEASNHNYDFALVNYTGTKTDGSPGTHWNYRESDGTEINTFFNWGNIYGYTFNKAYLYRW